MTPAQQPTHALPPGATLYYEGNIGGTRRDAGIQPAIAALLITMPVFLLVLAGIALAVAGPIGVAVYSLLACLVGLGLAIAGRSSTLGKVAIGIALVAVLTTGAATYVTIVATDSISDCFAGDGC